MYQANSTAQNLPKLPAGLKIASTESEMISVWKLRDEAFCKRFPEVHTSRNDPYDRHACVLYGSNDEGEIISTGRIVFDGARGLPADKLVKPQIDQLRSEGLPIAELSRLAITPEAEGHLSSYIRAWYEIARARGISSCVFICLRNKARAYKRLVGASVLLPDIRYSYGTGKVFSLLEWKVSENEPRLTTLAEGVTR